MGYRPVGEIMSPGKGQANKEVENDISLCGVPSSGRDYVAGGRGRQIKKLRTASVCVGYRVVGEIMSPEIDAGK